MALKLIIAACLVSGCATQPSQPRADVELYNCKQTFAWLSCGIREMGKACSRNRLREHQGKL